MFVYCGAVSMAASTTDVTPEMTPLGNDPDRWRRRRLGELAAHIHATTAELVLLLAELDSSGGWQGIGLRSVGHWASIDLGVSARVAQAQARAGQRLNDLPAIAAAALAGELGWDKISLLTQVTEPDSEAHWLHLAREMSVGQLARLVSAYRQASADTLDSLDEGRRRRGIWLFTEPDGLVRLSALLEPDDAAVVRAALTAHLELLWQSPDPKPTVGPAAHTAASRDTGAARGDAADPDGTGPAGPVHPASADQARSATAAACGSDSAYDSDDEVCPATIGDACLGLLSPTMPGGPPGAGVEAPIGSDGLGGAITPGEPARVEATAGEIDPTQGAHEPIATRRVDALVSVMRTALTQPGLPDRADDTTRVTLCVDEALLTRATDTGRCHYTGNNGSIPVSTARRICCDTVIQPLVTRSGQPIDLGRSTRTPSRALRRALRHRDNDTCIFPGCHATHWLDAHHLIHWADGGRTSLDNLALLCRHHHRLHHEGGYTITLRDGRPRFHRPNGTEIAPQPLTASPRRTDPRPAVHSATPAARSGGAPNWSLHHALDALLN
jgi:uncharacterized protein DUF222/HNH endonuclease